MSRLSNKEFPVSLLFNVRTFVGIALSVGSVVVALQSPSALADYPAVLQQNCFSCHGKGGQAFGRFNMNESADALAQAGLLDFNDVDQSLILKRVISGEMPLGGPQLQQAQIAEIRQWIADTAKSESAPANSGTATISAFSDKPLSNAELLAEVRSTLQAESASGSDTVRFFSLNEEKKLGRSSDELELYRQALAKTLNSLSWRENSVTLSTVGKSGLLYSVNIRDLGWDPEDWRSLFSPLCNSPGSSPKSSLQIPKDLNQDGRCPIVPVGPFVAQAMTTASYDTFIWKHMLGRLAVDGVSQFAEVGQKATSILQDDLSDLTLEGGVSMGFSQSGVTVNNRVLARVPIAYGYLWGSRDFFDRGGGSDLRVNPEVPADAGEYIFSLPNGLQAYFILNSNGQLIQNADVRIARDPLRNDHTVFAPASCISCHGNVGINSNSEANAIPQGFSQYASMKTWFQQDVTTYTKALQKIGAYRADSIEPVTAVLQRTLTRDYLQPLIKKP
jgi:mono/diheme cytochrome c family protein